MVIDTVRLQELFERQFSGAANHGIEKIAEIDSRHLACNCLEAVFGHACAGLAPALPTVFHDIVQRYSPLGLDPQLEIERERDERSLCVVADDCVARVRVLLVELRPGVEARFRDALVQSSVATQHARNGLAEQFQVAGFVNQSRTHECKIIVIRGDALEDPQKPGMGLGRQIVRRKHRGLHALHVPRMKVFVTRQAEKCAVSLVDDVVASRGKAVARADETRRPAVLQAAVATARGAQQEQVAIHVIGHTEQ